MVTVSSPSLTSRRSLSLPLPSSRTSTSQGGEAGSETNFVRSFCIKQFGQLDYYNAMSTQRHKFNYQPCLADEPQSTPGLGRVCMVAYL
jgi:hypothetical protein